MRARCFPHGVGGLAGVLLAAALTAAESDSKRLDVPFGIDPGTLRAVVATALDLDADGRGHLRQDACNWMDIDALALTGVGDSLRIELDLRASTGAQAFGRCVGPGAWRGRMRVALAPEVDADGLAVLLTPRSVELRRPDGSAGLLTRPARMLADALVLPALGRARLDLAAPLADIDHLVHGMLGWEPPTPQMLASRSRIVALMVRGDGVNLTLGFDVAPARRVLEDEPPLDVRELAAWARLEDELDGFLTHVIMALAERADDPALRIELLGVLLDTRHAIAAALAEGAPDHDDPVRRLFVESWDRLRPLAASLTLEQRGDDLTALKLAGFLAGGDALRALDALGPEYGVEISREGLRRLARMLLAEQAPATFTPLPLELDLRLRELFRLWPPEAPPGPPAASWLDLLIRPAHAGVPDAGEALHRRVPVLRELDDYLGLVAELLAIVTTDRLLTEARVPRAQHGLFSPLVRATAWKESCWRQWTGSPDAPRVLTSAIGAIGLMQIHPRVWRGLYDVERLETDIRYNAAAGAAILEHYLVDYALRRGEHQHDGGADNLVRATYAAYNGGPGQMARYRRADTPARLRAIDRAFWEQFEHIRDHSRPDPASCYPV